jgi:predicted kinase
MGSRGGRASQAMTALVLETYGHECHLRLKGCTRQATTKDHVIPYSHGGLDQLENYRPACKHCNSRRGNRVMNGYGASVVVLIGPPAAGKSTYLAEHAKPSDIQVDMDAIARALMPVPPDSTHLYPEHVRHVAIKARAAAVHHATRLRERCTVWLIHAIPKPDDLADYKRMGWQVITIDPGRDVVESRVRTMRPQIMQQQVARWYATYGAAATVKAPGITPDDGEPDW